MARERRRGYAILAALTALFGLCRSHEAKTWADGSGLLSVPPGTIVSTERNGNGNQTDDFAPDVSIDVTPEGSLSAHLPLWVPPGRAGMQPDLSLDYDSRGELGWAGRGWSLSAISIITRCKRSNADSANGLPSTFNFTGDDQLCVDDEPLVPEAGTTSINQQLGAFRTLHDKHTRYVVTQVDAAGPVEIDAYQNDGRILKFSFPIMANQVRYTPTTNDYHDTHDIQPRCPTAEESEAPPTLQRYGWALNQVLDRAGNKMVIGWLNNNDQQHCAAQTGTAFYPVFIEYASNDATGLGFTKVINLYWDFSSVEVPSWSAGIQFDHNQRLSRIEETAADPLNPAVLIPVKNYLLNYGNGGRIVADHPEMAFSLLSSVTECDGSNICKPPVTFDYGENNVAENWLPPVSPNFGDLQLFTDYQGGEEGWPNGIYGADFNHDGKDDLIYLSSNNSEATGYNDYVIHFSTSTLGSAVSLSPTAIDTLLNGRGYLSRIFPFDINGSGHVNSLMVSIDRPAPDQPDCPDSNGHECVNYATFDPATNQFGAPRTFFSGVRYAEVGDFDGDGFTDAVVSRQTDTVKYWNVLPNVNGGFLLPDLGTSFLSTDSHRLVDLDGDGSAEVVYEIANITNDESGLLFPDAARLHYAVHIDPHTPTLDVTTTTLDTGGTDWFHGDIQYVYADLNGDGLVDAIHYTPNDANSTRFEVRFNTGTGFAADQNFIINESLPDPSSMAQRTIDFNNDGRQDLLFLAVNDVLPNGDLVGHPFQVLWLDATPGPTGLSMTLHLTTLDELGPIFFDGILGHPTAPAAEAVLDVNGDGLDDIVWPQGNYPSGGRSFNLSARGPVATKNRMLVHIDRTAPLRDSQVVSGERFDISYAPIIDPNVYSDNCPSEARPVACVKSKLWVVSEIARSDDQNFVSLADADDDVYTYANGRADLRGRGFLGFEKVIKRDLKTGSTVEKHYDLSPYPTNNSIYPTAGLPSYVKETSTYTNSDGAAVVRDAISSYAYSTVFTAGQASFTYPLSTSRILQESVGGGLPSILVEDLIATTEDNNGNTVNQSVTRLDGSFDSTTTVYTYAADDGTWPRVQSQDVTETSRAADGTQLARSKTLNYDARWLLHTQTILPGPNDRGEQTQLMTMEHNEEGMPLLTTISETSARGGAARALIYTYDTLERAFPAAVQDSLGHTRLFAYHPGYGVLALQQDLNGVTRQLTYDGLGRVMSDNASGGDQVFYSYCQNLAIQPDVIAKPDTILRVLENHDGQGRRSVTEYNWLKKPTTRTTWSRVDGRPVKDEFVYRPYDGRLLERFLPQFADANNNNPREDSFQYDNLGRPVQTHKSDGSLWTYSYKAGFNGFAATTTDVTDNLTTYKILDSQDRVIASSENVVQPDGTLRPSVTNYSYGPFNALSQVTDAKGNTVTFEVNRLGKAYFKHDRDSGDRYNYYNAFGELETKQTPEYTTVYNYDSVGRALTETTGARVNAYTWDTAPNGIGKLASVTSPDQVTTSFTYDGFGRTESKTEAFGTNQFTLGYAYDLFGRIDTLTYPAIPGSVGAPFAVRYQYGSFGDLSSVVDAETLLPFWTKLNSDVTGRFPTALFGNSVVETLSPNAVRPGRLGEQVVSGAAGVLGDYTYDYDARGNVSDKIDQRRHTTQTFYYDPMSRMTRWVWEGAGYGSSDYRYDYDELGNMLTLTAYGNGIKSFQTNYAYDVTVFGPHQIAYNDALQSWYAYDGNGRQFYVEGGRAYLTYNEWDLPQSAPRSAVNYTYDGLHARVDRTMSGDSQISMDDLYQRDLTGTTTTDWFRIFAENREVAVREQVDGGPASVIYEHRDRLGSTELSTDELQNLVDDAAWTPQGDFAAPVPPFAYAARYSGAPGSMEGNGGDPYLYLYNFKGRIYDPRQMRFLTPDPLVGGTDSGQSWNPYSFVLNNPATLSDPTGLDPEGGDDGGGAADPDPTMPTQSDADRASMDAYKHYRSVVRARTVRQSCGGGDADARLPPPPPSLMNAARDFVNTASPHGTPLLSRGLLAQKLARAQRKQLFPNIEDALVLGSFVFLETKVAVAIAAYFYINPEHPDPGAVVGVMAAAILSYPGLFGAAATGVRGPTATLSESVVAEGAPSFFEGTSYTEKVLEQMAKERGEFHSFPEAVKTFEGSGAVKEIVGGDGVSRQMLEIPGSYMSTGGNWYDGVFQFIKEANGDINHRLFVPTPGGG